MQNAYESNKLVSRVIWTTLTFYLVAFAVLAIAGQINFAMVNFRANALGFIVIILEYWPVFLLIYYPRWRSAFRGQLDLSVDNAARHTWRVWGRLHWRHDICHVVHNRMAQRLGLRRISVFLYRRAALAATHCHAHWCIRSRSPASQPLHRKYHIKCYQSSGE
jgi:hypothetical protein